MVTVIAMPERKYIMEKVAQMPATRAVRRINSRYSQLQGQLQSLGIGDTGRFWCPTKEEANSIRSDVYKLIKELDWSKDGSSKPSQKTAICEESDGWALYVTRFG